MGEPYYIDDGLYVSLDKDDNVSIHIGHPDALGFGHRITMRPQTCDNFTAWLREQKGTATDHE